jgi:hypothetical protein
VPTFEFCLADVLETGRMPIRVDLSQISLFDVAAYQVLIRFGDRCERRHLVNEWVNPSGSVELMFRILGPPLGELVDGASESDFHRCRRLAVTRFTTMLRGWCDTLDVGGSVPTAPVPPLVVLVFRLVVP